VRNSMSPLKGAIASPVLLGPDDSPARGIPIINRPNP
jgi:hypothetical protein